MRHAERLRSLKRQIAIDQLPVPANEKGIGKAKGKDAVDHALDILRRHAADPAFGKLDIINRNPLDPNIGCEIIARRDDTPALLVKLRAAFASSCALFLERGLQTVVVELNRRGFTAHGYPL